MNPKFTQAIIIRKDCQWSRLATHLSKPGWRLEMMITLALTCLSSRGFTKSLLSKNCNRAKKQRLLQSSMFVSTITSWDYGYLFFLLLTTYRNFEAKTEDILLTKNSYFHINLIEVEQRRNTTTFLKIWIVPIFKLALTVGAIPVWPASLPRELLFY